MSKKSNEYLLGGPEPVEDTDRWGTLLDVGMVVAAVCGGFLIFTHLASPTQVRGATRSARLKWQQRNAEIEQAIAASQQIEASLTAKSSSLSNK